LKNKTEKKVENIDYDGDDMKKDIGNKELLKNKMEEMKKKNFNKWFNNLFENSNGEIKTNGYGEWLKSSEGLTNIKVSNKTEFDEAFKKKKKESRELIIKQNIKDVNYSGGGSMLDNNETVFSSDIFSKLKFDDVKKVHMETVVPVTEQDFIEKKRFDNVEQYIRYRKSSEGQVPDLNFSNIQMAKKKDSLDVVNTNRAYNLLMEDKEMKKKNELWWKNLKLLK